jgi:hypothetical protein
VAKWPGGASAIKPTRYISSPDLRICLPSTILCLEMAVIATLHLWAYPYEPYKLDTKEAEREAVPGEGILRYVGGLFGLKAIMDALNVWDLIKAIGRSARWAFKGRKSRELDMSYQSPFDSEIGLDQDGQKLSDISTGYHGPRVGDSRGPSYHVRVDSAEGQGLLGSAQPMPIPRPGTMERPYVSPNGRRVDISPVRELPAADIGVATSTYDEITERERIQELSRPPTYKSPYQPYISDDQPSHTPNSRAGLLGVSLAQRDQNRRGGARLEEPDRDFAPPPRTNSMNRRSAKNGGFF